MHSPMVAHQLRWTRIVVQIDTQQLPSAGTSAPPKSRRKQALARGPWRCHHLRWGPVSKSGVGDSEGMRVCETANREGHQIFTNELTRFAERTGDSRIAPLIAQVDGPIRVAVRGREGVGRGTVAAALAAVGMTVVADDATADVDVVVVAEALKPEDRAMTEAGPALVVLNKADLAGFRCGWPDRGGRSPRRRIPGADRCADGADGRPARRRDAGRRTDRRPAPAHRRACRPHFDRRVPVGPAQPAWKRARATAGHPGPLRHRPRRSRTAAGHGCRCAAGCAAATQPGRPRHGSAGRERRGGALPADALRTRPVAHARGMQRVRAGTAFSPATMPSSP